MVTARTGEFFPEFPIASDRFLRVKHYPALVDSTRSRHIQNENHHQIFKALSVPGSALLIPLVEPKDRRGLFYAPMKRTRDLQGRALASDALRQISGLDSARPVERSYGLKRLRAIKEFIKSIPAVTLRW